MPPGLDRPLFTAEQASRYIGSKVQVRLFAPEQGQRKFTGTILGAGAQEIRLESDGTEVVLDFRNVARARLVPDFDQLMAEHRERPKQAE